MTIHIFRGLTKMVASGEPGVRVAVRLLRKRGAVLALVKEVYSLGGRLISVATLNEPDGLHKPVAVKVTHADPGALERAIKAHDDWQVEDIRESTDCHLPRLFGAR